MTGEELLMSLGDISPKYYQEAEFDTLTAARKPFRRPLLIAAILALSLLLVGCGVAYLLRLQDMDIGESTYVQRQRAYDENGDMYIVEEEVIRSVISLQGLEGTAGFQAAKEWQEYQDSIDPLEILRLHDEGLSITPPPQYEAYGVCTQEMIDKVDEIAAKYGLKLAGRCSFFQRGETDFFLDSLRLDVLHHEALAQVEYLGGYFYECGNFLIEFQLTVPGWTTQFPDPPLGVMGYHDKDYFYPMNSSVNNMDTCEQWNHTLSSGQQVLIVRDGSRYTKIFCEREDAVLYLYLVDSYTDDAGNTLTLTNAEVQLAAEAFDFTVKPLRPDMEDVDTYLEEAYAEAMAQQEAKMETYVDPFALESYGEYAEYLLGQTENPQSLLYGRTADDIYYTILDFNGDGLEDFLHGPGEDRFNTVVTMVDGTTELLYGRGCDSYLCQGGIIEESHEEPGATGYYRYLQYENGKVTELYNLEYDPETNRWSRITFDDLGLLRQTIPEEEVRQITASFQRLDLNMKPIRTFCEA